MKKRRELDALVTNGKLPRRKSKSGHELLRSNDSDSSEVEEFSVPIGSKTGKKWIGICPCSSCVALLVFIVMTSCLIACGGLIWMHFELKRDLDNLRERLLTVENRNQGTPEEFQKYHSQIQELNKTVHSIRVGDNGLNKIGKNLTQISTQLDSLKKVTDGLREDLQKAPLLKDLPNRFESLTSTVAKMGSDVQNANTQLESLDEFKKTTIADLEDLKKRVTDVENHTRSAGQSSGGREHNRLTPLVAETTQWMQQLQMVSQDIDSLNSSLTGKLMALNNTVLTHETRLSLLETFTAQKNASPESEKDSMVDALNGLLADGTKSDENNFDLSALISILEKAANLTTNYEKLQADVNKIKSNPSTLSGSSLEELAAFQTDTLSSLEDLNATVIKTNEHVDHLFKLFTQNRNELNNVTAHLAGLVNFISSQKNGQSGSVNQEQVPTTPKPPETSTLTTASTTKTGEDSKAVEPEAPTIKMKLVNNLEDLETGFNRWDRSGEDQVDPDDLPDFMPDAPSKEQLKPFDVDNNGKYSLEEFKAALGFKSDTATEEVKHIFE